MGAIPAVPSFPAGEVVTGAAMQELCTALTWCMSGRPVCRLTQGSAQSVSNTTATAVTWDTKVIDRDSGWSSGSNTRYTAQTPGIYLVAACVAFASNATGDREIWFRVTTGSNNPQGSGVTIQFGSTTMAAAGGATGARGTKFLTPYLYDLDYVEVLVYQDSGGALSTTTSAASGASFFTINLVSS